MGFFDFIFGSKPNAFDIKAYNYHLFFEFIPKKLHLWEEMHISFDSVIYFKHLINNNKQWKSLVKHTKVTSSGINQNQDITLYLITAPSNEQYGEVYKAIIAINKKLQKSVYYILEYSFEDFAICSTDESGNHFFIDKCENAMQFGAYVIKAALETLVPPKSEPVQQQKPKNQTQNTSQSHTKYTAENFLKRLDKLAEEYFKKRGVFSLDDWIVTKKVGDDFRFYITQDPDIEFEDPNCEVTLMVDFLDHNGRMKVVNKFFPKKTESSSNVQSATFEIPNIIGKHYILDDIRQIQMGSIRLQPIDYGLIFNNDALQVVQIFAEQSPRIKKYLPNLNLSSVEDMRKYFDNFCKKTELGYEFGYAIKMNNAGDNGVIGFIFVHTPSENQYAIGFPEWTIDFCLFEPLEGKGIMRTSIIRVLKVLKSDLHVSDVYAIADEYNAKCIKLLSRLPFDCQKDMLVHHATGNRANLFKCDLTKINFQHS